MKPFNLKEYLKDPSKKVVTRDGRDARIICTDRLGKVYPVVALWTDEDLDGNTYERIDSYTKDGKYNAGLEYERDLFFDTVKKEGWATIYGKFLTGEIFSTKEEAEESVKRCGTKDFVAIAKVEWEE